MERVGEENDRKIRTCMCVCVCMLVGEKERACVCVSVGEKERACVCVCECVWADLQEWAGGGRRAKNGLEAASVCEREAASAPV